MIHIKESEMSTPHLDLPDSPFIPHSTGTEAYAIRRLAAAVIQNAYREAAPTRVGVIHRAPALAWLASKSAIPYFELVDIDQEAFLLSSEWRPWAREALLKARPADHRVISTTLTYFEGLFH